MLVPVVALGFLVWTNSLRVQRVQYVTSIPEWSVAAPKPDAASPSGYTGGTRRLIVPEHNNRSYQWILETQQMLARGAHRLRHVDYDNAPQGRETHAPSLFRWWLATVARFDHALSREPNGSLALSVERAALFADPLLLVMLLIGTTLFVARQFGAFPAALVSVGLAGLFPFAGGFLPGAPDHRGWATACALWSVLPLLAGIRAPNPAAARRWFFFAGTVGGIGLWFSVASGVPVIAGVAIGALAAAWIARGTIEAPWRAWSLGGAVTTLVACMLEYFPDHLSLQLQAIHPLYAIAWLGAGELIARGASGFRPPKFQWRTGDFAAAGFAIAAIALLPVAMRLTESRGFVAPEPGASRVTFEGLNAPLIATCLPLLLVVVAVVFVCRRSPVAGERAAVALALGPVFVALGFACFQLRWFNTLDALLLPLLVALTAVLATSTAKRTTRRWWAVAAAVVLVPGMIQLLPPLGESRKTLGETDVEGVVTRDLAHWLAQRTGGQAIVLASPDLTVSLAFHGGLRGLATLDWENKDGLAAAVRIAAATSPQEALALIQQRGVTHIVAPSWDESLEELARLGSSQPERAFATALKRWAPLVWLRPIPYQIPRIAGFEGRSIAVFEVVEEQEESTTLIRQAEYFVEMGQAELAAGMRRKLQRFPSDLGAMVALAQIEVAREDAEAFRAILATLVNSISAGADRSLTWERRVSLAIVLAQGKRADLAREQVRRCLADLDEPRIRSLTTDSLFRLLVLAKNFGVEISTPRLRELALSQLPPDTKEQL
ncbi:MAG TPA: hypothetical protein VHO24_14120 [Opitutaceae bacterium]|nr:hypothetical protein [Opitutaceae bacterium]